eukprot:Selendium_serpulae@DN3600_c0_g1_i2.p1
MNAKQLEAMEAIQRHGKNLLEIAMKLGRVFIITNAMEGWVQYSAKKYLPELYPVLEKHVTIVSARSHFEESFPGMYQKWKIEAFLDIRKDLKNEIITNLVSVGDSTMEMEAVQYLGNQFSQALVKTIKFRDSPSPDELAKQLELVGQKFERICLNAKNLKIGLERKWVNVRKEAQGQQRSAGPSADPWPPTNSQQPQSQQQEPQQQNQHTQP